MAAMLRRRIADRHAEVEALERELGNVEARIVAEFP